MNQEAMIAALMAGDIPKPASELANDTCALPGLACHGSLDGGLAEEPDRATGTSPLALIGLLWLTGLTWWFAIPDSAGYSFDDREAIIGNPVVEGSLPASAAFDRDYWHHLSDAGHYRPLATLALRMDAQRVDVRSAEAPRAFRLTNLWLHMTVVLLLGLALIRLERTGGPSFPWFGLGLFAVHPASADAVAWISGRTSLLSAMGAAIALGGLALLPTKMRQDPAGPLRNEGSLAFGACLLGVFAALLAKEDGLVVALAVPLVAVALPAASRSLRVRRGAGALLGATLAVLGVAWMRYEALGAAMPHAPSAPLAGTPLAERLAFGLSAWWQGLASAVTPWVVAPPSLAPNDVIAGASLAGSVDALTFGEGIPGWGLLGAIAAIALVLYLTRRHRGARLSLLLACAAAVPLLQLVPAGELYAPRFLYQPRLSGMFGTSALALALTYPVGARAGTTLRVATLLAFAWFSLERAAPVYDSRASYWNAHLPAHEHEAKIWNALGECAREDGDRGNARAHFEHAHALDPHYSRPLASLGALEARAGNLDAAEAWFEEAIIEGPREHAPRGNLATILLKQGRAYEALEWYQDAARLSPGRATYHRGVARARIALNDIEGARTAAAQALALAPEDRRTQALLADLKPSQEEPE